MPGLWVMSRGRAVTYALACISIFFGAITVYQEPSQSWSWDHLLLVVAIDPIKTWDYIGLYGIAAGLLCLLAFFCARSNIWRIRPGLGGDEEPLSLVEVEKMLGVVHQLEAEKYALLRQRHECKEARRNVPKAHLGRDRDPEYVSIEGERDYYKVRYRRCLRSTLR